jgi:hypothetical protein
MRIIAYAGEHFLTSDAIATEVLNYAKVLAFGDTSDVVNIPVVLEGRVGDADLIIGPASQITSIDTEDEAEVDLDDADAVAEIRKRATLLESPPPAPLEDPDSLGPDTGFDDH